MCAFAVGQLYHGLQNIHVCRLPRDLDLWIDFHDSSEVFIDGIPQQTWSICGIPVSSNHTRVAEWKIRKLGLIMLCSDDERDICDSPNQQKSEREASIANRNNQIGEKPD